VMSDLGFGPTTNVRLQLNRALAEAGLLQFVKESGLRRAVRALASFADRVLRSTLPGGIKKLLAGFFPKLRAGFESLDEAKLEWRRTTAYTNEAFRTCPGIWLNRDGERPEGTIPNEAAAEETIEAVQQSLQKLLDPQTGRPVVSHVYRTDEIYRGPFVNKAPALLPSWWEDGFVLEQSDPYSNQAVRRSTDPIEGGVEFTGGHRLDGVFIMAGGPVKRGFELRGCKITDVAPTVLYLMGQPIPSDMDGKVLTEGFDADFVAAHRPQFEKIEGADDDSSASSEFTEEESELIAERLKALGYI
jgi:predicted AlkP superfamily phosphohydrolase/phosphomutase